MKMKSRSMLGAMVCVCVVVVGCSGDDSKSDENALATGGTAGQAGEGGSSGQSDGGSGEGGVGGAAGGGATGGGCEGESTQSCDCGVQTRTCDDGTWSEWSVCATECGPLEACYEGKLCVAKMVSVDGEYWIDATEVSRSQYEHWLGTNPSTSGQNPYCSENTDYTPGCAWPPGTQGETPVACVDWCDANTYCAGIGKRLCGKIGGGSVTTSGYATATLNQWYNACSAGGQNDYQYGDVVDEQACNGPAKGLWATVSAGSLSTCSSSVSGFTGIFDLSGNVWEWEDSCGGTTNPPESCNVRGGSFYSGTLRCDDAVSFGRGDYGENIGFRCCADNTAP